MEDPAFGGRRERTRQTAMKQRKAVMKPRIRVAHANPTLGKRDWSMRGKMIPPREPPAAARPVALPRFAWKKWPIALILGVKMSEVPVPPMMPITSMKCQYSVSHQYGFYLIM